MADTLRQKIEKMLERLELINSLSDYGDVELRWQQKHERILRDEIIEELKECLSEEVKTK